MLPNQQVLMTSFLLFVTTYFCVSYSCCCWGLYVFYMLQVKKKYTSLQKGV